MRDEPEYSAGGDRKNRFNISEELGRLTVEGIVWDEIDTLHESFVESFDKDWAKSTRFIIALGSCKKGVIDHHHGSTSPYESEEDTMYAFWTTIFAGQKIESEKRMSEWLPEVAQAWHSGTPLLTVLDSGRLERLEMALANDKVVRSEYPSAILQTMLRGVPFDQATPVDTEWTDEEQAAYKIQFHELASLWQSQPYDLYHRPFQLPFVVPDSF